MGGHTSEPWEWHESFQAEPEEPPFPLCVVQADGGMICYFDGVDYSEEECRANAERIVTCVNALAGLSNKDVASPAFMAMMKRLGGYLRKIDQETGRGA